MKKFTRFIVLLFAITLGVLLMQNVNTVYATDVVPTTTLSTEAVVTTAPEDLPDLIEDNILDTVAPKVQLGMQIGQAIITAIGMFVIFKQRIEVAVTKRKAKEATDALTVERSERQMVLKVLGTLGYTMDIIVQNSKLPATDKIAISKLISEDQAAMALLSDTIAEIAGMDKADVSAILDSVKDMAGLAVGGINAIKTGNLKPLTDALGEATKEE